LRLWDGLAQEGRLARAAWARDDQRGELAERLVDHFC
jgi:hypothetical protein